MQNSLSAEGLLLGACTSSMRVDLCPQQQRPLHCFYSNCKFGSMGYEVFV